MKQHSFSFQTIPFVYKIVDMKYF